LGKETDTMNPYEKLEHADRAWTVAETAAFLGYSVKHVYRLIHQGKIEGWRRVERGRIMFCPCKLKEWIEKTFNGNGIHQSSLPDKAGKEGNGGNNLANLKIEIKTNLILLKHRAPVPVDIETSLLLNGNKQKRLTQFFRIIRN
jgi:excisionase family DNA binding protein